MYLEQHHYYGGEFRDQDYHKEGHTLELGGKFVKDEGIKTSKVNSIVTKVAYWRKANQIHEWFVENIQDGNDNCQPHHLNESYLTDLLALCKEVKTHIAKKEFDQIEEKLPSREGFFFGPTEVHDEWYAENIDNTIEQLSAIADSDGKISSGDYYYQSSW